jgi:NAD(P)-dependent dehydrogenase (short-subunit alcohol dehydrogenase family)
MVTESFTEKAGIVTGGGSGIGRATALAFAERGATVVIADIAVENAEETLSRIESRGGNGMVIETDVTDMDQVRDMVETTVDEYGRLDFAFNNAGVGTNLTSTVEYEEDDWNQLVDINLTGVWRCMKIELEQMLSQDEPGAIVNTSSVMGQVGGEQQPAYTAAKHGVVGVTKVAALEHGTDDIRINAVCPGFVDTPMAAEVLEEMEPGARAKAESLHAMDRFGQPEEIAGAVTWLCSEDASFVTGTAVPVDGGFLSQ